MTSEERVLRTIEKQEVGGIPICFHFSDEKTEKMFAKKLSMDIGEFRKLTDSDIKRCYLTDDLNMNVRNEEFIKFALAMGFAEKRSEENIIYDQWGIGWFLDSDDPQMPANHPLNKVENILDFKMPEIDKEGQFHLVERMLKQYKQDGYAVIIPQFNTIFEKAWLLMGYENFLIQCYENKEIVEILLDKINDYRVKMAEKIVKYNVTCGHTGDDYGTQRGPVMSLQLWRELFKPRLKRVWDVYNRKNIPVLHHSCGDCRLYLNDMIDMGLKILNPVQPSAMPIKELKKEYGKNLTFYGGINTEEILTNGTPGDIRKNVHDTVSILGKNRGLILSPINIMGNVPIENLKALIESVNEYR